MPRPGLRLIDGLGLDPVSPAQRRRQRALLQVLPGGGQGPAVGTSPSF